MSAPTSINLTSQAEQLAEAKRLQPVEQAAMAQRPGNVEATYAELEYDALASEQVSLWDAEADGAIRAPAGIRDDSKPGHDEALRNSREHRQVVDEALRIYLLTYSLLNTFRHREPGAKKWYLIRWAFLLGGDVAGQVGAALSYGETPWTAVPQAVATGIAALTAGLVGIELRNLRDTARRSMDESQLPGELEPWAHLFKSPDPGRTLGSLMIKVGIVAGLCISGGILALRAIIEGTGAGLVYGLLAVGITLASAVNAYFYADEIADQIDATEAVYGKELRRAESLASSSSIVRHATATSDVATIRDEYKARGLAAKQHVEALKWRVMGNNPHVAGHGHVRSQTSPGGAQ